MPGRRSSGLGEKVRPRAGRGWSRGRGLAPKARAPRGRIWPQGFEGRGGARRRGSPTVWGGGSEPGSPDRHPASPRSGRGPGASRRRRQPRRRGARPGPAGRGAREAAGGHHGAAPHHLQPGLADGVGRGRGRRGPGGGRRRRQPGAPARRGAGVGQLGAAADVQRQLGAAARGRRRRRGQAGRQLGAQAGGRRRRQLGAAPPGLQPARPAGPQPRRLLQPCHPGCGQQGEPEGSRSPCALPPGRVGGGRGRWGGGGRSSPPRPAPFLASTLASFLLPPEALPRTSGTTCVPTTPQGF